MKFGGEKIRPPRKLKVPSHFRSALFAVMFVAFFLLGAPTFLFAQSSSSFGEKGRSSDETLSNRKKPKPTPTPIPRVDAERDWGSTGTDFNTGANWVGGIAPGLGDVAWFKTAEVTNPNLSGSLSISGLYFSSTTSSGYNLTNTNSATLTLTGYASNTSGAENSDATAVAIGANNTSGTNTISVPISLAPSSGSISTVFQAAGGTLVLAGNILGGLGGTDFELDKTGAGTVTLAGTDKVFGTKIYAGTLSVPSGGSVNNSGENMTVAVNSGNNGSLIISGGTVSDFAGTIGLNAGSVGIATVSSGTWNNNFFGDGYLIIGESGSGTLHLTGTGIVNSPHEVIIADLSGSIGTLNIGNGGAAGTLNTPQVNGGSGTATVNFNHTDTNTFAPQLTGSLTVNNLGSGTTILTGSNSYTGGTVVSSGTLQLSGAGTLGSTAGPLTVNGGTLDLNGTSQGIGNLTGTGGTILNNGGGAVTLTVGNGNGGGGNYAGVIADHTSGTGTTALTKTGTGTITLSGANTYSGLTTINAGKLIINGSLSNTAVTVNSGGSLGGTGTIGTTSGGSVTISSGGSINLVDGSTSTLTVQSTAGTTALTLAGSSALNFEIGPSVTSDNIAITNSASLLVSGPVTLNITGLSGFGAGTYNLFTFGSGLASGLGNITLGTRPGGAFTYALGSNSTNEFLTVSLAPSPAIAFWKGDQSATWNTITNNAFTNWYTDATGTTNTALPGSNTDVTFATTNATVANLNTTLGADFSIKGLTILGTSPTNTNSVMIGGANTLTLGIDGLTVNSGAAAVTLSTNVALGASQVWTNNSTHAVTVSGIVSETGGSHGLTKAGAGTLILSGPNTYTGVTTINSGILNIQNATALGTTAGGTTVNDNATLQIQGGITVGAEALTLSGVFGKLENVSGTNNYGGLLTLGTANSGFFPSYSVITSDAGTLNLTNTGTITGTSSALYLYGAGSGSISSILGMTSSYLIKDGTGTWTLSGANAYNVSGNSTTMFGTSIYDGTLKLSGSGTLGSISNGLLVDGGAGGGAGSPVLDLNGTSQGVGNLDGGELGSGGTILNNGGGAVTLTIGNGNGGGGNYSGVIADHTSGTGTIALTKTGTGTITLSGANTYSGATAINAGILNIQNATALGTTAAGTTVSSGATLQIQSQSGITVGAEALTISGTGASGATGALENVSGTNNYGGLLKLGAASTISSDSGTLNLTNTGTITGATFGLTLTGNGNGSISSIIGTTTGTVTVNGFGTWTLLGANTYTGTTTIGNGSGGILNIQNATALGTAAGGTVVNDFGTLQIQGGITVGAEALRLSSVQATLENVSGTNNYGGLLTLGPTQVGFTEFAVIQSDAGTLNLTNIGTITGASSALDLTGPGNGTISSILGMTGGYLRIDGPGTWTLSGANTYNVSGNSVTTAGTQVLGGTLKLSGAGTLGNTSNGLFVDGGILDLNGTSQGVGSLFGFGGTILNNGTATNVTLTVGNGNADGGSFAGVIADHTTGTGTVALTKIGTGAETLSGANTYSGVTTISAGILNIQSATALGTTTGGTTVSSGATLQLQGGITVGAEALTIRGIGASGATGALESIDGNNYGGLVTLGAASTISSDAGTLSLTNTGTITGATFGLTLTGAGNGSIASIIGTTSGALIMSGSGTWTLAGANTYTGGTTINSGTLQLSGAGTLGSTSGALTVNTGGILDLNATSQGVGNLTGSGSAIVNNGGGAVTLTIGNGNGGGGNFAGIIADNNNSTTGTVALTKTGTGTITLSGANTYSGLTTIGNGTLSVGTIGNSGSSSNLGSNGTINVGSTTTAGTLLYTGSGETSNKVINLNGTTGGAIIDQSGTGLLKFTSNLTATGVGGKTLTLQGSTTGTGEIDGVIVDSGSGATAVTKTGTGTWTLLGANNYTGATTISNGILNIQNATALGTTAAGTTVSSGATLQIQGDITVGAEALTISGVGETTATGALENFSGTNNYGGLLKLGAASTISSDANSTLNLTNTGTITGAFGLTLTGAGDGSIASIIGTSTGSVTKTGTGTWILSGANTYTGAVTISAGILNIQNATALGTAAGAATVSSGATLQIENNITVGAQALTISGIGASGATGALENVSGMNNYGGLLKLGAASTISSDAGTLNLTNAGTITGATFGLTLTGSGDGSISSIIGTTTGTLSKSGSGTWTLKAANTYTGLTTVTAGTLAEGVSNALSTGALTVDGPTAIFDLGASHTDSVGTVTVDGGGAITGTGTSALTSTGTFEMKSGTVSAILAGSGVALNKTTAGTVTLSGANTYTGATTVNAGSLFVNGSTASGSAVTVSNSGTVLGGTGTIHGTVTINSGAAILGGDKTTGTTLTVASNLTLTSGSIIELALGPSLAHSTLARTGGTWSFQSNQSFTFIDLGATTGTYDNIITGLASNPGTEGGWTISNPGFVGTFTYDGTGNIDLTLTAVPEPSTWFGGALAFAALAFTQRRRFVRKPESSSSQLRHRQRLIGLTSYI